MQTPISNNLIEYGFLSQYIDTANIVNIIIRVYLWFDWSS